MDVGSSSFDRPPRPAPAARGVSPPNPSAVSRAGADLMLLLIRANIPSGEMLNAKTDRDMALIAVKYGIELPLHLAHLPTLPPPKSEEQKEALSKLAAETAAADNAHAATDGEKQVKDRPPRRARMRLGHASEVVESPSATPQASPQTSPAPSARKAPTDASPTGKPAAAAAAAAAAAEDTPRGGGTKERAPTNRRKGGKGKKKDKDKDKERVADASAEGAAPKAAGGGKVRAAGRRAKRQHATRSCRRPCGQR